jgi:hypothetical protein
MDTNLVSAVNQAAQSTQQIVALSASLFSSLAIIIAIIGRSLHAAKTGNPIVSGLVSGTNAPIAAPNVGTLASTVTKAALILVCTFGLAFVWGCSHLAAGADPFVVRVEQGEQGANATFDLVLNIDNADRGFWKTNAPAFHTFCSWLRTPTPYQVTNTLPRSSVIQLNVEDLKLAYQASKTTSNSNALWEAFSTLSAAIGQASSWANIATNSIH